MKLVDDAHFSEYGVKPEVTAEAPGRFHLIGEHSWFFKDKTLSMAANIPIYVALSRRDDMTVHFYFVQIDERKKTSLSAVKFRKEDKWANAVKSVIFGFSSIGCSLSGLNITIYSDVLPSAGFGITTAIKAATCIAIKKIFSLKIGDAEILQVIERGNKKFLQIENHIADNYAALFAKKGNLILTDHQKNTWDYIPYKFNDKQIVIVDTHVPRFHVWDENSIFEPQNALLLGDLKDRKNRIYGGWEYIKNVTDVNEELSVVTEDVRRKLLAIIREHGDVLNAVSAFSGDDFFKFARAINHSHETMRDFYESSCPEIDWILKRVSELEPNLDTLRNPISCGRITGKGFGRCLYAIIRNSDMDKFKSKLLEFERIFGFKCDLYMVEPSDGAKIVRN